MYAKSLGMRRVLADLVEESVRSLSEEGLRDEWIIRGSWTFLANTDNRFTQFSLNCVWKLHPAQLRTLHSTPRRKAGNPDIQLKSVGIQKPYLLLHPGVVCEEPLPLKGWTWPFLPGTDSPIWEGASCPTGRKSMLEPSAHPLSWPISLSGGVVCGRHHDFNVYFGLGHIPTPLAFKSSFFWLFFSC